MVGAALGPEVRPALLLGQALDDVLELLPADELGDARRPLLVLLEIVVEVTDDREGVLAGV